MAATTCKDGADAKRYFPGQVLIPRENSMGVTNYATLNGQLVGETGPNGTMYYHTDALGSVTMTTGSTGAVLNTYRYKPYGTQLSKSGTSADPKFTWAGSLGYRATGRNHSDYYVR